MCPLFNVQFSSINGTMLCAHCHRVSKTSIIPSGTLGSNSLPATSSRSCVYELSLGTSYKWHHKDWSLCVWTVSVSMFSRILLATRTRTSLWLSNTPLYAHTTFRVSTHLLMDVVVSTRWPLWIMLQWHWHTSICLSPCFQLFRA